MLQLTAANRIMVPSYEPLYAPARKSVNTTRVGVKQNSRENSLSANARPVIPTNDTKHYGDE
jgi:hypothetical protein